MRQLLIPTVVVLIVALFVLFVLDRAIEHNIEQLTPTPTFVEESPESENE
jgi:energy-converting hydrogenase Eha subunit F